MATPLSRRRLLKAGIAVGAVAGTGLLGAACAPAATPPPAPSASAVASKRGGKIIWAMSADPGVVQPFGGPSAPHREVHSLIYESLLAWDKDLNIQPALAESYSIENDRTYVFKLRKGVMFHSGKELDATDVKYSLELQKSPPPPSIISDYYPQISSVDVVDKYTARVNMSQPDATLLGYLGWGRFSVIVPAGLYEKIDTKTKADGTGPYKLDEYVPNDHLTLNRHTNYWNPNLPNLDQITMKILGDEQARVAAVRSGAVDGATITADSARSLAGVSSVQVLKGTTAAFRELEMTVFGKGKPWDDVRVRQAVNFAIDRQEIIDKVYGGDAEFSGKIPPGYGNWPIPSAELKSKWQKYDVEQAKQLMAAAGFSKGFSVVIQSRTAPTEFTNTAQIIKGQLQKINVDATIEIMDLATFAKNNGNGSYEWGVTGRALRGDPIQFLSDFQPDGSTMKLVLPGYKNAEMVSLYAQALTTADPAKRLPMIRRMQEIALTDLPFIPLVLPIKYQIVSSRLKDYFIWYDDTERALIGAWVSS